MTGAFSRAKGKRGELEVVHLFRDYLGIEVNRNYKQAAQSQHGDIEQTVGGYLFEIKNCQDSEKIRQWWAQTVAAASARNAVPCLAYKVPRRGWRFVVPMDEAWATSCSWRTDLQYTNTMFEKGFFLHLRERINGGN